MFVFPVCSRYEFALFLDVTVESQSPGTEVELTVRNWSHLACASFTSQKDPGSDHVLD